MFGTNRRGPEWKQGWSGQTLASICIPPPSLLLIFGIVIVLLWFSQNTAYESQLQKSALNFQLFIFLLPVALILFMAAYFSIGRPSFRMRARAANRGSGSDRGGFIGDVIGLEGDRWVMASLISNGKAFRFMGGRFDAGF
ncbi:hypothetical protein ACFE04_006299 [Oxalis oulophora]